MDMSIKQTIPDEATLRGRLQAEWVSVESDIIGRAGPLEAEYKKMRWRQRLGMACWTGLLVIFGFADAFTESDVPLNALVGEILSLVLLIGFLPILIILAVVGYYLVRDKTNVVGRFNLAVNEVLFPYVLKVFGVGGSYLSSLRLDAPTSSFMQVWKHFNKNHEYIGAVNSSRTHEVVGLLDHSELVTEARNRITTDDMIHIPWNDGTLFISELDIGNVTGSGKRRKVKQIFKGYFVSLDTKLALTGKTFISTEGDKKGFGHRSFWKNITGNDVKETELEWNQFEDLLHVASNNPTEARYVLTTDFMVDLYDWWQDKKQNIRISFVDSRMYLLFPDKDIRLHKTAPSLDTTELQKYAMSIATPLLHVLHLIEDVKK